MSTDQLEAQITELDNLPEHREIVTFMRRSAPLNTSQRTALEQYQHLILEYPVGDLRQHFEHPERPLTVEIGFGMGRSLVLMAKANPERNYVGIEVHVPGIAQCVYEAGMAGLTNLRVLDADAIQVLREMPDDSINCVQLYFPDPWQKSAISNVVSLSMNVCNWWNKSLKLAVHFMPQLTGNLMLSGCWKF
jgi:tRNA (guanine-N7-)-methyltransferase